ncbi:protein COFACTOR ASSEMBLY OF COMPLEX C SUBUNIT B CCB4, chloroplastic isoform X3 [Durio zibethinus]|uniref:Protein COFACTOR ASSEMBLY OF COMPLEX C SUBUNIT B CCB4, chloroplastic isoform X3 n=1 Tax=Durio zibethinus TaxID=66656 RepID=A0A6P5XYU6_DURZI|nr:protein COFACTOR ASSEMBLY OF COMPLEX C SUBUNIT B CCB4, chloroplastic isoform X3 [Durio zibethinus]
MEAGRILHIGMPWTPGCPHPLPPPLPKFPRFIRASSIQRESYKGPKPSRGWIADWVSKNDDAVRSLPIYVGGASLLAVLFNRAVSGIAPVADASRAWESLSAVTCCRSLVIVYNCQCIAQIGVAAKLRNDEPFAVDAAKLMQGSLCQGVLKSGAQSYLANLSLYPGRSELPFLPSNTQAVILQPLGDSSIAILGGDTIRGFTTSDQAWITYVGEKLDATLSKYLSNMPSVVQE